MDRAYVQKYLFSFWRTLCSHFPKKKSLFIANSPIMLVSVPNHLPKTQQSYRNRRHRLFAYTPKITVTVATVTHCTCIQGFRDASQLKFEDGFKTPPKALHRHHLQSHRHRDTVTDYVRHCTDNETPEKGIRKESHDIWFDQIHTRRT